MFPKKQRLTEKRTFANLFKRGTWARGRSFSIIGKSSYHPGKIGFVITRKTAKSAVDRNRAKRRLRAVFYPLSITPEFRSLFAHSDLMVLIHRLTESQTKDDLVKEATSQLKFLARTLDGTKKTKPTENLTSGPTKA